MAKRHSDELAHERRRTNPEQAAKANPINYVLAAIPPFLIMVGDRANASCPTNQSLCAKFYRKKGADSKLIVIKGVDRGEPQ